MHSLVGLVESQWIMDTLADLLLGGRVWSEEMVHRQHGPEGVSLFQAPPLTSICFLNATL